MEYRRNNYKDVSSNNVLHDSYLSGELLKMEARTSITGENGKIKDHFISLERTDYRSRIFGDAGISKLKLYHFYTPSTDLIGGARRVKGIYLSNKPLVSSGSFSNYTLSGELKRGWEVELYLNGIFLERKVNDEGIGSYQFSNIRLFTGTNKFKLIFFGPSSEAWSKKIEKFKNVEIDKSYEIGKHIVLDAAIGVDSKNKSFQYVKSDFIAFDKLFFKTSYNKFFTIVYNCFIFI